jgi:hypothetical protein
MGVGNVKEGRGTKLWVVDTTFNGVTLTKSEDVTTLLPGGLEIILFPVEL